MTRHIIDMQEGTKLVHRKTFMHINKRESTFCDGIQSGYVHPSTTTINFNLSNSSQFR